MPGLTDDGFEGLRLPAIKEGMEADARAKFGKGIKLSSSSFLGQIIGIIADRLTAIWELAEAVYDSFNPDTASGAALDEVVSLNGIQRLAKTHSTVKVRVYGTLGESVPDDFVVSVEGVPAARFTAPTGGEIDSVATDEVQTITFSPATPSGGAWKLTFDGEETASLDDGISAATLQGALEALSNVGSGNVTVAGDTTAGFVVTFVNDLADTDVALLEVSANTLTPSTTVTVTETVRGGRWVELSFVAEEFGPVEAPARSLTVIETPASGVDSAVNPLAASVGRNIETDAELRLRRAQALQRTGTATVEGIRTDLINNVANVTVAIVIENATDEEDGEGRPPHSIECIVEGGDEQAIADEIWSSKGAGIETVGNISKTVTDSMGIAHTIKFSRPTGVPIYLIVNLDINTDESEGDVYPDDGDDQVIAALVEYGRSFVRGQDVVNNLLYTPVNLVPGVIGVEILQSTSATPTLSDNISIPFNQVATFDADNIEVNS